MITFLIRRLLWLVIVLLVVYTITFPLMYAMPGGPFMGERALDKQVERNLKARYQLDRPLYEQYFIYLANVLRGDFGPSYKLKDFAVNDVIRQGFPISVALGTFALSFALILGLSAGVVSAVARGSFADVSIMTIATMGIALPSFVIAGLAIIVFVFLWPLFPPGGWGGVHKLILPGLCLGAPYAAYIARLMRTGMLEVMQKDYIRTARAKGLTTTDVIFTHAMRGAVLPVVSFLGPATAGILTGSLVVEMVFAIPGLGRHFIEAALQSDYLLSLGLTLLYTALLYTMNTVVDLAYAVLDPRVTLE